MIELYICILYIVKRKKVKPNGSRSSVYYLTKRKTKYLIQPEMATRSTILAVLLK